MILYGYTTNYFRKWNHISKPFFVNFNPCRCLGLYIINSLPIGQGDTALPQLPSLRRKTLSLIFYIRVWNPYHPALLT